MPSLPVLSYTFVFRPGFLFGMTASSTSPTRGRGWLALGANDDKAYDEERLERASSGSRWATWARKSLRIPRMRRVAVCLLVIDLIIVCVVVRCFEPLITLLLRNEEMFGARLTLPVPKNGTEDTRPEQRTIARILHQTSATYTIPDDWVESQQSCKDAYADFEYKHWTDELAREFIAAEYPWFLDTWDHYTFPIQRADSIRYFVLYHYGGIYLDMDTLCNETIPLHQLEADGTPHHSVWKITTPTGVSNDFMIASAGHPVMADAISSLIFYNKITRWWAKLLPHAAIMISAGPFFVSMSIKNYLLEQPSLPTPAVSVINATELAPYITDLEGCSWHHGDTKTLMWVGDRPWVWFTLGGIGLVTGLHIINHFLLLTFKRVDRMII